jgi:CRP-like cAMP-binding protein
MNPAIDTLRRISPLSEETIREFAAIMETRFYLRNEPLLSIGRVSEHFYFIVRGLARVYYLRDGNDVTDYFAVENQFIGAVPSLITGLPSHKAIEALEDCEVLRFRYRDYDELCRRHHDLERNGRKLGILGFLEIQERMESIRFHSARERYEELERKYPGITNRVPLKHLASFIGTTQVSVSRIRAGKQ